MGEGLVDNCGHSDEELGFGDKDFSANLALELGNSGGCSDIKELGLDKWVEVLGSSTVHWHS